MKRFGGRESYGAAVLRTMKREVPEMFWDLRQADLYDYLHPQHRAQVFLRGLARKSVLAAHCICFRIFINLRLHEPDMEKIRYTKI